MILLPSIKISGRSDNINCDFPFKEVCLKCQELPSKGVVEYQNVPFFLQQRLKRFLCSYHLSTLMRE